MTLKGTAVVDTIKSDTLRKSGPARRIALLGAPIDIGASQRGTLMGPAALRTAGIARVLAELNSSVWQLHNQFLSG